jgi:hypothetical protein
VRKNRLGMSREDGKVFQFSISNAINENGTGVAMTVQPPAIHAWPRRMKFRAIAVDVIPGTSQNSGSKGMTGMAIKAQAMAS